MCSLQLIPMDMYLHYIRTYMHCTLCWSYHSVSHWTFSIQTIFLLYRPETLIAEEDLLEQGMAVYVYNVCRWYVVEHDSRVPIIIMNL